MPHCNIHFTASHGIFEPNNEKKLIVFGKYFHLNEKIFDFLRSFKIHVVWIAQRSSIHCTDQREQCVYNELNSSSRNMRERGERNVFKLFERCRSFYFNYKINEPNSYGILMLYRNLFTSVRYLRLLSTLFRLFAPTVKVGLMASFFNVHIASILSFISLRNNSHRVRRKRKRCTRKKSLRIFFFCLLIFEDINWLN